MKTNLITQMHSQPVSGRFLKTTNCVSSKSTFNYIRENMVNPYFRETQQEPFVNRTNTPLPPCDRGKK